MQLKVYNKENALLNRGGLAKSPAISFGKNGVISLNKSLVNHFNLKPGHGIEIAQDPENEADWFFKFSENGIPLRTKKTDDGSLLFNSSIIVKDFQSSIEYYATANGRVIVNPNEQGWYLILTASGKK